MCMCGNMQAYYHTYTYTYVLHCHILSYTQDVTMKLISHRAGISVSKKPPGKYYSYLSTS